MNWAMTANYFAIVVVVVVVLVVNFMKNLVRFLFTCISNSNFQVVVCLCVRCEGRNNMKTFE